jgi:hypothetical protein
MNWHVFFLAMFLVGWTAASLVFIYVMVKKS